MASKYSKLTRPALKALKQGERINEHGIVVERTSSGDLRYAINIMVDRRRIHRVIGRESEGVTREQAERAIEAFRTKAREERLDLPSGRKTHRTFAEAGDEYLSLVEHHPKFGRNLARKRQHIRERLVPYFGGQRLDKITDFGVSNYIKRRQAEGGALATINRELATLSHLFGRAIEWGWIKSKPRIHKGLESRKQIVILSREQRAQLLKAAQGDQDPLTWLFVALAMGTAMRHGEILRIRWEDVQFGQRRIHIAKAKAGQRSQPMPSGLAATLEAEWKQLGKPEGYIFATTCTNAKSQHRTSMADQFRRSVRRAGLNSAKVTPHVLRHTAITELVQAGVDLPTIQKVSGHKTLTMVLRYTHLSDAHVNEAVDVLERQWVAEEGKGKIAA